MIFVSAFVSRAYYIFFTLIISLVLWTSVSAQTINYGDTVTLGAGKVFTWVETDNQNAPLRIGISFTAGAITNPSPGGFILDFPNVTSDSLFRHAYGGYAPTGHSPFGIYDLPHYDMHFYMITRSEREAISDGNDPVAIPAIYMPEDYTDLDGTYSIYQMGVHFVDSLADELHGQTFDETLLYGFYRAKMIFVEPMITRAFLLTNPDTTFMIKQPEAYQRNAYYPQSYVIRFNSVDSLYEIYITDFVMRVATSADDEPAALNKDYILYQNYPNPFNPATVIQFGVLTESHVKIEIFNMLGELVDVLINEIKPAGNHSVTWKPGSGISSGIYLYKMTASETSGSTYSSFRKMTFLK